MVYPYALVERDPNSQRILQNYDFLNITSVGFLSDDPRGIVITVSGRGRLFLVNGDGNRSDLASRIKAGSEECGVGFTIGAGVTSKEFLEVSDFKLATFVHPHLTPLCYSQTRAAYGTSVGEAMCAYSVTKQTQRHENSSSRPRTLTLTQDNILEKDTITGSTVSCRSLKSIFAIVRCSASHEPSADSTNTNTNTNVNMDTKIRIEYKDGLSRTYFSSKRDALACSILDAALSTGNTDVCVTEGVR